MKKESLTRYLDIICVILLAGCFAFSQNGGRAEPERIQFDAGSTSATLTGTLSGDEQKEYIFTAKQGQRLTVRNSATYIFRFRVFRKDFEIESDFGAPPEYSFDLPVGGDYIFYVIKKDLKGSAKYKIRIDLR